MAYAKKAAALGTSAASPFASRAAAAPSVPSSSPKEPPKGDGPSKDSSPLAKGTAKSRSIAEKLGVPHTQEFVDFYSDKHVKKQLKKAMDHLGEKPWEKHGLAPTEYIAMRAYTLDGYKDLNAHLRGTKKFPEKRQAELNAYAKQIKSAFEKMPNAQENWKVSKTGNTYIKSYRGVDAAGYKKMFGGSDPKPGQVVQDKAVMSTSYDQKVTNDFGKYKVTVFGKNGKNVTSMSKFGEKEVAYKPGTKFKVLKVETGKDGSKSVLVSEVHDG